MKKIILILTLLVSECLFVNSARAYESTVVLDIEDPKPGSKAIRYKTLMINGLDIFYREAGDPNKPTILLLHGFPSSSHMYRDLIADLADQYHLIAPDYPGFGHSSAPSPAQYTYSFDQLATTINLFINALGLKKFSLYVQDYGGPIGFRIATQKPECIQALIVQNANAYEEGLGEAIKAMSNYFENPNPETEKGARWILSPESSRWQYSEGASDATKISPDAFAIDQFYLDRPGNDLIQLSVFRDYKSNLMLYGTWQAYFRKHQPPTLVISGKDDKIFIAPGAIAFKNDIKEAQISLLDGGHFVLEEKHEEAATLIKNFLKKRGIK